MIAINYVGPYAIVAGNPGQVIQTKALPDVIFPDEISANQERSAPDIIGGVP